MRAEGERRIHQSAERIHQRIYQIGRYTVPRIYQISANGRYEAERIYQITAWRLPRSRSPEGPDARLLGRQARRRQGCSSGQLDRASPLARQGPARVSRTPAGRTGMLRQGRRRGRGAVRGAIALATGGKRGRRPRPAVTDPASRAMGPIQPGGKVHGPLTGESSSLATHVARIDNPGRGFLLRVHGIWSLGWGWCRKIFHMRDGKTRG